MIMVDQTLSEAAARDVAARPTRSYLNAALALACSKPDAPLRRATYVEGACLNPRHGVTFAHAWLELDGYVVDPTFTTIAVRKIRMQNREQARHLRATMLADIAAGIGHAYRGMRRYSFAEVSAALQANRPPPLTLDLHQLVAAWDRRTPARTMRVVRARRSGHPARPHLTRHAPAANAKRRSIRSRIRRFSGVCTRNKNKGRAGARPRSITDV